MGIGNDRRHRLAAWAAVVLMALVSVAFLAVSDAILSDWVAQGEVAPAPKAADPSITFGVLGDWSSDKPGYPISIAEMKRLVARGGTFVLSVGDLGYQPGDEANWCSKIKSVVDQNIVVAGNHDDGTNTGGNIDNYVQYCPFNMDAALVAGPRYGYGKSYYFDYPRTTPLVRVIMITAGLSGSPVSGQNYNSGGAEYTWTLNAITSAKAASIPWVIVGVHKLCINAGSYGCEIGQALWDGMITAGADMVVTGHYHVYERSYQLAHTSSCTSVKDGSYNAACVTDFDNTMVKGAGLVQVTDGAGGTSIYAYDGSNDGQYFPAYMMSNTNSQGKNWGWGPLILRLNATTLVGSTAFCPGGTTDSTGECPSAAAGTFQDSFTITSGAPPPPPALAASFSFSPSNPVVGQSVTFTGSASGGTSPYSFSWTFGDGSTGTGATAAHAYATASTFTATLTATDSASHTATASKSVVVSATPPALSASFSFSPASPSVGQSVTFTGSASGGTSPYTYAWAYGDGATGTGATSTHTYATASTFTATLTVTDAATHTATASKSVVVSAPPALTASVSFSPSSPVAGQAVTFTGTASGGVSPYTYAWAFGDGATGSGASPSHTYSAAGTYTATLTLTDAVPQTATASKTVTVGSAPPPTLVATHLLMEAESPDPSTAGQAVTLSAVLTRTDTSAPIAGATVAMDGSDDGGTTWWSAGTYTTDGSGRAHGSVVFLNAGSNQVLRARYAGDATYAASTSNNEPHVTNPSSAVTASFSFAPSWPRPNVAVNFDASASSSTAAGATLEVRWDWTNDGTFETGWSSTRTAAYTYPSAGTFTARLQVRDSAGNWGNTTHAVPVDGGSPSTTSSISGTLGSAGWYRSSASVTLAVSDDLSGVASTWIRRDGGAWAQGTTATFGSDGIHSLDYYSVDRAGNTEATHTLPVRVDTTPPTTSATLEGIKDVNGSYVSSVNVTLAATDAMSGVAGTKYRLDHGAWQTYLSTFRVTGSGVHLVEYNSTDIAGDLEPTRSASPTIASYVPPGSLPPVSTLALDGTMGPDGWYVTKVTVTLSATSPSSLAVTVAYRLDGGAWHTYASPFPVADGIHTLEYNATDSASNEEAMQTLSFRVDTGTPVTTENLTGTHGRDHWWTSAVDVTLTARDVMSGVALIEYRVDGSEWKAYGSDFLIGRGRHVLEYRSTDLAGLTEVTHSESVKVDDTAPKVTMSGLTTILTYSSATVSWIGQDDVAGIVDNGVSVDGGTFVSVGLNETATLSLSDGAHVIRVRVTDDAGNVGTAEVTLRVDTNLFSPTGPYQGVPLYMLLQAVLVALIVLVVRHRTRVKRQRRQQALRRMQVRARSRVP